MKLFNGNGCCTRCAQATLSSSLSLSLAAVRRVNKVKQMEKQPQSHAHLVADRLSASASVSVSGSPGGFSLPTIAVRQTIFLLSSAIHAGVGGRGRQGAEGGVASVYFTAAFPVAFLLLAQRSVRCTTFSAFVKRIKSMRQQKWKQKRMITGREQERERGRLSLDAGSGRAAVHCVCLSG